MSTRVPPPNSNTERIQNLEAYFQQPSRRRVPVPDTALAEAKALYDQGLPITALGHLSAFGPPGNWDGPEAGVFAARLSSALGGARTAVAWELKLARRYPQHPEAVLFGCYGMFSVRGPLEVLDRVEAFLAAPPPMTAETMVDFISLKGHVYGTLKDFDRAEECFRQIREVAAHRHWTLCEEASVAESADDLDRAIALCQEALTIRPRYRPAAERLIEWLLLKNRDAEATALIYDLGAHTQWAGPAWTWQRWLSEKGQTGQALETLDAWEARSPLLDKGGRRILAAARSSLLLEHGDFAGAAEWAEKADSPFHRALAESGKQSGTGTAKHFRLPVGFVRQNDMTCAPATLTMLAQYWGLPADHPSLADEICYDGTPGWKQRQWLEQQGWAVREFTVTPDSARALLNNGVPFALATVDANSAHLQAIIGYDDRTGCLVIRDPNIRHHLYFTEKEFYKRYAAWGPRGTAFSPRSEAHRFMGLPLPDTALHDLVYAFDQALGAHRRTDAGAILTRMEQESPGHSMVLHTRMRLRLYDGHPAALACVDELLARYPDDQALAVMRFRLSAGEVPRAERLSYVRERIARPDASGWWLLTLAGLLSEDARYKTEADEMLRRLKRTQPGSSGTLELMISDAARRRDWARLLNLRRFAACLNPRDEGTANAWMETAQPLGRAQEVLTWLYSRWQREGKKDGGPALTLMHAVKDTHGAGEALRIIEHSLTLRPADGFLMLSAMSLCDETGAPDRAAAMLQAARGKVPADAWHRAAARRERMLSRPAEAVIHWRSVLAASPVDMEAHYTLCDLLGEMEGREAAARHVEQARALLTSHVQLRHLHISMLRSHQDPRATQIIEAALAADPLDVWCLRELAHEYSQRHRPDDALAAARRATEMAPHQSASWIVLGEILAERNEKAQAAQAFAHCLTLDTDAAGAMSGLLNASQSSDHRRAVLDWMLTVMDMGFPSDAAIVEWAGISRTYFSADEQLERLRRIQQQRPHLWQSHATIISRLSDLGRHDEATAAADEFCRLFPAQPGTFIVAGETWMRSGNPERAIDIARRVIALTPNASMARQLLADACKAARRPAEALDALRSWHQREPRNPHATLIYGAALWDQGEHREAWELIEASVAATPEFEGGWAWLCEHVTDAERIKTLPAHAAAIAAQHPHRMQLLVEVAKVNMACGQPQAADEAMVRVLSQRPGDVGFNLTRIAMLMNAGRVNDALRSCRPTFFGKEIPAALIIEEARILEANERIPEAIAVLEELSARFPNDPQIWADLTGLYHNKQQWSKEMAAAERAACLRPGHPVVHNTLGWVHLSRARDSSESAQHTAAAEAAFRTALKLDATHTGARHGLVECLLRTGRTAEACREVDEGGRGLDPAVTALFQLIIAFRTNPDSLRTDAAVTLVESDSLSDSAIFEVHNSAVSSNGAFELWKKVLDGGMRRGAIRHPALLRCWAACQGDDTDTIINALGNAPMQEPARRTAWTWICFQWLERNFIQAILDGVARFPQKLTANDKLWETVTDHLFLNSLYERVIQWTSDWRARPNADASTLTNAAAARLVVLGIHEAVPVWRAAVERVGADEQSDRIRGVRCDLAVAAAMAGRYDEAAQLLADAPVLNASDEWCRGRQAMRCLASALIAAGKDRNPAAAANQLRALDGTFPGWRDKPSFQKLYPAVMEVLQRLQPKAKLSSVASFKPPKQKKIKPERAPSEFMNGETAKKAGSVMGTLALIAVLAFLRSQNARPKVQQPHREVDPMPNTGELLQKAQKAKEQAERYAPPATNVETGPKEHSRPRR